MAINEIADCNFKEAAQLENKAAIKAYFETAEGKALKEECDAKFNILASDLEEHKIAQVKYANEVLASLLPGAAPYKVSYIDDTRIGLQNPKAVRRLEIEISKTSHLWGDRSRGIEINVSSIGSVGISNPQADGNAYYITIGYLFSNPSLVEKFFNNATTWHADEAKKIENEINKLRSILENPIENK